MHRETEAEGRIENVRAMRTRIGPPPARREVRGEQVQSEKDKQDRRLRDMTATQAVIHNRRLHWLDDDKQVFSRGPRAKRAPHRSTRVFQAKSARIHNRSKRCS